MCVYVLSLKMYELWLGKYEALVSKSKSICGAITQVWCPVSQTGCSKWWFGGGKAA